MCWSMPEFAIAVIDTVAAERTLAYLAEVDPEEVTP